MLIKTLMLWSSLWSQPLKHVWTGANIAFKMLSYINKIFEVCSSYYEALYRRSILSPLNQYSGKNRRLIPCGSDRPPASDRLPFQAARDASLKSCIGASLAVFYTWKIRAIAMPFSPQLRCLPAWLPYQLYTGLTTLLCRPPESAREYNRTEKPTPGARD